MISLRVKHLRAADGTTATLATATGTVGHWLNNVMSRLWHSGVRNLILDCAGLRLLYPNEVVDLERYLAIFDKYAVIRARFSPKILIRGHHILLNVLPDEAAALRYFAGKPDLPRPSATVEEHPALYPHYFACIECLNRIHFAAPGSKVCAVCGTTVIGTSDGRPLYIRPADRDLVEIVEAPPEAIAEDAAPGHRLLTWPWSHLVDTPPRYAGSPVLLSRDPADLKRAFGAEQLPALGCTAVDACILLELPHGLMFRSTDRKRIRHVSLPRSIPDELRKRFTSSASMQESEGHDTEHALDVLAWSAFFDLLLDRHALAGGYSVRWNNILSSLEHIEPNDNPKMALIIRIAEKMGQRVADQTGHLRRVLARERRMVPVGRVIELDTRCLARIARTPGHTLADKSGARQQLMAVAKRESFNTLENRVLKDFVFRCRQECSRLAKFGRRRRENQRLAAVKRFRSICTGTYSALARLDVKAVPSPLQPNYVLQYDTFYGEMWSWYRRLLSLDDEECSIWAWQSRLWGDVCRVLAGCALWRLCENQSEGQRYSIKSVLDAPLGVERLHRQGQRIIPGTEPSPFLIEVHQRDRRHRYHMLELVHADLAAQHPATRDLAASGARMFMVFTEVAEHDTPPSVVLVWTANPAASQEGFAANEMPARIDAAVAEVARLSNCVRRLHGLAFFSTNAEKARLVQTTDGASSIVLAVPTETTAWRDAMPEIVRGLDAAIAVAVGVDEPIAALEPDEELQTAIAHGAEATVTQEAAQTAAGRSDMPDAPAPHATLLASLDGASITGDRDGTLTAEEPPVAPRSEHDETEESPVEDDAPASASADAKALAAETNERAPSPSHDAVDDAAPAPNINHAVDMPEGLDPTVLLRHTPAEETHEGPAEVEEPADWTVYSQWPFGASEAKERQRETALSVGIPFRKEIDVGGGVMLGLVLIPAGEFEMGSAVADGERTGDECPRHRVAITRPFYVSQYQVVQAQYESVMAANPSRFKGPVRPVDGVVWDDAVEFCGRLSRLAGCTVRLPTEAEWEYCCRAGTETLFHYGNSLSSAQANFDGRFPYGGAAKGICKEGTSTVGIYPPNAWGLHDMHGNVLEWCSDWYASDYYTRSPLAHPQGYLTGVHRVLRGGSWRSVGASCRSAKRIRDLPDVRGQPTGLRVVAII